MIHVARVDLCKELYELSGWNETSFVHECLPDGTYHTTLYRELIQIYTRNHYYSAYDLCYLLRRLPKRWVLQPITGAMWMIEYQPGTSNQEIIKQDEIPEDAVCKLAIELFKRGILEKEKGRKKYD